MDQRYSPLDAMASRQRSLAILFVDVSDSVKLYESLGDAVAFRAIRECLLMFEEETVAHSGRVVKTIGDGSLCAFVDPNAAVRAACAMQRSAQGRQTPAFQIGIRIGLHHGPVLVQGDDVYGDTVNTASRMVQFAAAGHIVTTGETVALLTPDLRSATRRIDVLPVKGKLQQVAVYHVLWAANSDSAQTLGDDQAIIHQPSAPRLRLKHAGREVIVVDSITLGRDPESGIVLMHPMASRHHGIIERRKGQFVLIDHSRNNTFVTVRDGEEFILRREAMALHGFGIISFGHRPFERDAEIVGFFCESDTDIGAGRRVDNCATALTSPKTPLRANRSEIGSFAWVPEESVREREEQGYTSFLHTSSQAKCFRTVQGRKEFLMRRPHGASLSAA